MGKKKSSDSLGRALIRDRFSNRSKRNDCMLHTSELNDGYDWGRLNLQSVTEESSFDDFLRTAELAGTEFQAEKLNVSFVNTQTIPGILNEIEKEHFERTRNENKQLISIPRRPKWGKETTGDELKNAERESFLEWRRGLALLQQEQNIILTPYEKNLDFWRQLWRVVERSDIVVQILDARNPLLFRCEDLEKYVTEVDSKKLNFLLLNKSDLLTQSQRSAWALYFDSIGVKCAFYSAVDNLTPNNEDGEKISENKEEEEGGGSNIVGGKIEEMVEGCNNSCNQHDNIINGKWKNSSKLLSVKELISLFESLLNIVGGCGGTEENNDEGLNNNNKSIKSNRRTIVGMVGYPNVGKSSTINSIIGEKKVSVSATPGKTKHFQTLNLIGSDLTLCDCPGLVMPSMVSTKGEMILFGILPIDQMRDFVEPIGLLRSMVPDHVFESLYGIMVPQPPPGTQPPHVPYPLLNSYAYCRGFMTQNGQPDCSRASRLILKDFVNGRILYCLSPPGVDQHGFHQWQKDDKKPVLLTQHAERAISDTKTLVVKDLEKNFFKKISLAPHVRGNPIINSSSSTTTTPSSLPSCYSDNNSNSKNNSAKPWKDHSHKRNKREKLRRVYRHLDE